MRSIGWRLLAYVILLVWLPIGAPLFLLHLIGEAGARCSQRVRRLYAKCMYRSKARALDMLQRLAGSKKRGT